jgi:hypothetical protein
MKPNDFVAWALAVGVALILALAGIALVQDVWIVDFPRLRALAQIDGRLLLILGVICVSLLPATLLVFLFKSPKCPSAACRRRVWREG